MAVSSVDILADEILLNGFSHALSCVVSADTDKEVSANNGNNNFFILNTYNCV